MVLGRLGEPADKFGLLSDSCGIVDDVGGSEMGKKACDGE